MAKRTAVIDIGSNSIRMVVFEKTSRFAFHLLHEIKSPVRISEGTYENGGSLQEAAMERAIAALGDFLSIAASYKVRKILCVATSAVRDATNRSEFLSRVRSRLHLNIKVIDGLKEAYFGGIACANLLPKIRAVTIDIGGGSTECACLDAGSIVATNSLNLGTVRLKELFFDKDDIKGAKAHIDTIIDTLPIEQTGHMIGVGGTFRALSNAIMKQQNYPLDKLHGYTFDAALMIEFGEKVLKANENELKLLGIKPERYDIIKSGTLILLRIIKRFNIIRLTTSGAGVREGVYLHDLLRHNNDRFPSNFNPSVRSLMDRYIIDTHRANLLAKITGRLFDLLSNPLQIPAAHRSALIIAAKLAKIGASLHFYSHHHHGYYLIQTALEYGFTHEEVMLIATLVRYQKKKTPKRIHKDQYSLLLPDDNVLDILSMLLTLADTLVLHHPQQADYAFEWQENLLTIRSNLPLYLVKEQLRTLTFPFSVEVLPLT